MNDHERTLKAWERIKSWLEHNLPEAVDNLRGPASEERIAEAESHMGLSFPDSLKSSLMLHDGEEDAIPAGAMPDCHCYLSVDAIEEMWDMMKDISAEIHGGDDTPAHWRSLVEDGIISVKGPVKPLQGSHKWIPVSDMNGNVQRYIDFDPAPGGTPGQVIEVDPEGCLYQVIAPSFADFLEEYADDLEKGLYVVADDCVQKPEDDERRGLDWGIPDYLKETPYQPYDPAESCENRSPGEIGSEEEVIITGTMGFLMGGPETMFSIRTEKGREYSFLAKPDVTRGYGAIAVRQGARVKAKPYSDSVSSIFVDQLGSEKPDFVALEYSMLKQK